MGSLFFGSPAIVCLACRLPTAQDLVVGKPREGLDRCAPVERVPALKYVSTGHIEDVRPRRQVRANYRATYGERFSDYMAEVLSSGRKSEYITPREDVSDVIWGYRSVRSANHIIWQFADEAITCLHIVLIFGIAEDIKDYWRSREKKTSKQHVKAFHRI
jgi:hypothetical protein